VIRGVPPASAAPLADALLLRMGLGRWADRQAGTYSGGNRRKLSCAIALCGEPPCIFLDEPSSGMDAESRRAMWAVLADSAPGRAMVLTTHSMDEAEALCTRVGIMVAGRLRCLGSIAHLKATHGDGHTLELRSSAAAAGSVAAFLAQALPSAVLTEEHAGRLTYAVPPTGDVPLADVFDALERARRDYGVSDYSLVQCSLEQIFVKFASGAVDAPAGAGELRTPLVQALSSVVVPPPSPQPAVRCPSCQALLRWASGASVMRCGACDALVGLPAPAW
jgi:LSD1 subclass zinc finger protein